MTNLQSYVNTLHAHALKQDEELAAWAKSSTNMAWNLGSRLSGLERDQNHIQSSIVTPTLALTHILANVEGENTTNTATEDLPSYTKGETEELKRASGLAILCLILNNLLGISQTKFWTGKYLVGCTNNPDGFDVQLTSSKIKTLAKHRWRCRLSYWATNIASSCLDTSCQNPDE
ncbi:hypothetical protein Tco_0523000 [Tanacetum coccineum]